MRRERLTHSRSSAAFERRAARGAPMAVVLASLVLGCEGPGPGSRAVRVGPLDEFASTVESVLEARCAQGGCHGRPDRPFALFRPGVYRADDARTHLFEPLTIAEVELNALRLAALAGDGPAEASLALRKPLSVAAGGVHHGGGDVFVDRNDPGYLVLLRWLRACVGAPVDGGTR